MNENSQNEERKEGRKEGGKEKRMNESKFIFITYLKKKPRWQMFQSCFASLAVPLQTIIFTLPLSEQHYVNLILRCGVNSKLLQQSHVLGFIIYFRHTGLISAPSLLHIINYVGKKGLIFIFPINGAENRSSTLFLFHQKDLILPFLSLELL